MEALRKLNTTKLYPHLDTNTHMKVKCVITILSCFSASVHTNNSIKDSVTSQLQLWEIISRTTDKHSGNISWVRIKEELLSAIMCLCSIKQYSTLNSMVVKITFLQETNVWLNLHKKTNNKILPLSWHTNNAPELNPMTHKEPCTWCQMLATFSSLYTLCSRSLSFVFFTSSSL